MMTIQKEDLRGYLLRHIRMKYGTQRKACEELKMHRSTLCRMLAGGASVSPELLADAGLVARTVYEKSSER